MQIRDLTYLPLDLPRFDHQKEVLEQFSGDHTSAIWTQHRLTSSFTQDLLPYDSPREWLPEAKETMPSLIKYIEEYFPFETIVMSKIHLWRESNLMIHVDIGKYDWCSYDLYQHQYEQAPAGYRIILNGEAENVLYYTDSPDTPKEHWKWAQMPTETNSFVHSSIDSLHGAVYGPEMKRMILLIHGWLNPKHHQDLLERSYRRYSDFAISFEDLTKR